MATLSICFITVFTLDLRNLDKDILSTKAHDAVVTSIAFYVRQSKMVSVALDGSLFMYDFNQSRGERMLLSHHLPLNSVDVHLENENVIVAGAGSLNYI
jgi:WD40 repeat protein